MPGIVRIGDTDSNGNTVATGSPNVFADGIPVARLGDILAPTGDESSPPTPIVIISGSPNVFVNGIPVARIGDADNDGAVLVSGSFDVSAN